MALAHQRLVSLTDRTVAFTSRTVGRARLRTTHLDAREFLRRCLQHGLPHGFMTVRPFGVLHTSCAIPLATIRLMIGQAHPRDSPLLQCPSPPPFVARCPTCGAPRRVVRRLWASHSACVETS